MTRLDEVRDTGRMAWADQHRGWLASPEDLGDALISEGFEEYKREMAWTRTGAKEEGPRRQGNPGGRRRATADPRLIVAM